MPKPVDDFAEYIVSDVLCTADGRVTCRKMFGGYSLYLDGIIFGLITSESELFFKVDKSNQAQYEAMGSHPFVYAGWKDTKRKPLTMPYWLIPEDVLEDREKIIELMELSADISKK
jgi:DNA transformation protein